MFEIVQRHPLATGAIVIVGGVVLLVMFSGGKSGGGGQVYTTAQDPNAIAANSQLQAMQMQMAQQSSTVQASVQAAADKNATEVQLAQIAAASQGQMGTLAAQIASLQSTQQTDVAKLTSTLQAQVAQGQISAQTEAARIAASTTEAQIAAFTATTQKQIDAATAQNAATLDAMTKIQLGQQATQVATIKASDKRSTAEKIFKPCTVTTACCEYAGLPDDCYALTMMRKMRDEYVRTLEGGEELIREYYETAPLIVERIKAGPNPAANFDFILRHYILPGACAVEAKNMEMAYHIYRDMLANLKAIYHADAT